LHAGGDIPVTDKTALVISIIIGAGPAGLTAGIYLSRARAKHRSNNMGQIRTVITMVLIFLSLVVYSQKNDSVKVHLNH